jgi:hypothetical protein
MMRKTTHLIRTTPRLRPLTVSQLRVVHPEEARSVSFEREERIVICGERNGAHRVRVVGTLTANGSEL